MIKCSTESAVKIGSFNIVGVIILVDESNQSIERRVTIADDAKRVFRYVHVRVLGASNRV